MGGGNLTVVSVPLWVSWPVGHSPPVSCIWVCLEVAQLVVGEDTFSRYREFICIHRCEGLYPPDRGFDKYGKGSLTLGTEVWALCLQYRLVGKCPKAPLPCSVLAASFWGQKILDKFCFDYSSPFQGSIPSSSLDLSRPLRSMTPSCSFLGEAASI